VNTVDRGGLSQWIGRRFDLNESLLDEPEQYQRRIAPGYTGVLGDLRVSGLREAIFVFVGVLGAPQKVVNAFFCMGECILSPLDTMNARRVEQLTVRFSSPQVINHCGRLIKHYCS
jgi:hypothetical protein